MVRGKANSQTETNSKLNRLSFKKRRIGLIKKAMQLSKLSNCQVSLKIFWAKDGSLVEYLSDKNDKVDRLDRLSDEIK